MLAAVYLGRFGQDRCSAGCDQHVTAIPQRRVGGGSTVSVTATAFEAEHQFRNGDRFTSCPIDFGQHFTNLSHSPRDRLGDTPLFLNIHHQRLIRRWRIAELQQASVFHQERCLCGLAPESDYDVSPDIRMTSDVCQCASQLLMVFAAVLDGAAPFVNQRNDAVNVWEVGQQFGIKFISRVF